MKRSVKVLAIALSLSLLGLAVAGCGSNEKKADDSKKAQPTEQKAQSSDQKAQPSAQAQKAATGPTELAWSDKTDVVVEGDYELTRPEYRQGRGENEFCMTDYISDASLADGWWYYYTEYEGDTVDYLEWPTVDGCYASCVNVLLKNLQSEPADFASRISAKITFDAGAKDEAVHECTYFQYNEGQIDSEGYRVANTKVFDKVNPGETMQFGFYADIPRDQLDSDKPLVMTITIADGGEYVIDLRAECADIFLKEAAEAAEAA